MNKILGIFGLLIFVCLFTTVLSEKFDTALNLYNVTRWSALFGILSIGVSFVIITGGIDLSIGSVVCLAGCVLAILVIDHEWPVIAAMAAVMGISLMLGLVHGLLITKLKLQPFVVTLCGLLFYRGFARWIAADQPQGFGQDHNDGIRMLAIGKPCNMAQFIMIVGALVAVAFLTRAIWQVANRQRGWEPSVFKGFLAAVLAIAGSSQYWGGENQGLVLNVLGHRLALEPRSLLVVTGLAVFVPSTLTFIAFGLRDNLRRNVAPLAMLILSLILFDLTTRYLAPRFGQISPGSSDPESILGLTMRGGFARTIIMSIVFGVTGALMGSIGWLATSGTSSSETAKRMFGFVVFGGVVWLVGMTRLPETMVPMPLLILIGCTIVASVFLNQTIYGRYLLALGRNEEAARYSGINTDRMIILAYVICAGMAGLGAILFAVDINNMQPANHGNIYELYAIAAAVLGGCSLRGGEGSIVGVIIGAAVVRVLYNAINTLGIDTKLEWAIIGVVILTGVIADEVVKRMIAAKRARLQADDVTA